MKTITVEDCRRLKQELDKYCETAEQHEFVKLFIIDTLLKSTLEKAKRENNVADQKNANAMFQTVYNAIGKNFDEYKE